MKTMDSRLELHEILVGILGTRNVYFQPPANIQIRYPAIIYSRNDIDNVNADNLKYLQDHSYQVTYIDKDPDSEVIDKLSKLEYASFSRHYAQNNLNYDVFTIYYK